MSHRSILATLAAVAAFGVPTAFADQGGIPHDGSNGQGRPADQQQTSTPPAATPAAPVHPAHPAHPAHPPHPAKPKAAKPKPKVKHAPKGHRAPQARPQAPNSHAKAGKTTICHATGSQKNPYVTITISNNAIPAHRRHQDGRDIIPAPADGCPKAAAPQQEQEQTPQQGQDPQQQVAGIRTSGGASGPPTAGAPAWQGEVLGARASGTAPSASSSPAAMATRAAGSHGLPFTGHDVLVVALLGVAALGLGLGGRRLTTTRI